MSTIDLASVTEIQVKFNDGQILLYRGSGIEKLRKQMVNSFSIKNPQPYTTPIDDPSKPEMIPQCDDLDRPVCSLPTRGAGQGKYSYSGVVYQKAGKDESAKDVAERMIAQAKSGGLFADRL